MKIFKYAGPPGTGKSTALLKIVEGLLSKGVPPEDIVFTTFTRAGAHEAKERAIAQFKLPPSRLPYFKTLHSLCFSLLPNETMSLMTSRDWCEIAKTLGIFFSVKVGEEGVAKGCTKGDALLSLWSLSRVLLKPIQTIWEERDTHIRMFASVLTFQEFEHFIATVTTYKQTWGKMDYTDILEHFLIHGAEVGANYVIVDEAQDLSPLQWSVVRKLSAGCKELHIAGDDDQAIHEWNGAKPELFIEHRSDKFQVLPRSYRIPNKVHSLAVRISKRIKTRLDKEYTPREEEGEVIRVSSLDSPLVSGLLGSGESTFILVRNHSFMRPMAELCRWKGINFRAGTEGLPETLLPAVIAWRRLVKNEPITKEAALQLYAWMSTRDRVTYGFKGKLMAAEDRLFTYAELKEQFGLVAKTHLHWSEALDKAMPDDTAYLKAMEKKGDLEKAAFVEIATIHAVKGKEADNVIIVTDMAYQTKNAFHENPDAEHRVWYVGVTRAKKRLLIATQNTAHNYDL